MERSDISFEEAIELLDKFLDTGVIYGCANHLIGCCGTCVNYDRLGGGICRVSGFSMEVTEGCFSSYKVDIRYDRERGFQGFRPDYRPWRKSG
jgi:hypothetical protein